MEKQNKTSEEKNVWLNAYVGLSQGLQTNYKAKISA